MTGGAGNSIYSAGVSYFPNSDLNESYDSVNGRWKYTYDDFNRLNTAVSNTGLGCAEVHDRFGNRLQQTNYTGTCTTPNNTPLQVVGGILEYWLAGFGYDSAGNLTYDGTNANRYDAEGRIAGITGGSTAKTGRGCAAYSMSRFVWELILPG